MARPAPAAGKKARGIRTEATVCGICPAGCWVEADVAGGRLAGVRAQPGHPLGMICRLGEHSADIVHSPDRLTTPLRRVGPKGAMDFEPISWDTAYDIIVEQLRRTKAAYGPEAAAIYTGRGSFDLALCDVFQPLDTAVSSASSVLFPFGSPNTFGVGALCYVAYAMIAPHVTMGSMLIDMDSELEQAELIVVWGNNPATDCPPMAHAQIVEARRRGAEVVVIDPRRIETAKAVGAEWIPIRPGTDGALALGMIQALIEEDLYDEKFVSEWTVGFDELRSYAQHFTPEAVEEITWVPAATIRQLARRIRRARGASPVMYTGLEYSNSGVQAIRATMILWALAGQLDVPGGRVFRMRRNAFPINKKGLVANPSLKKAIGRERFPIYSHYRGESHAVVLPRAVLEGKPYPIKSLIVLGASITTAWPQPEIWRRTLAELDFLVTIDRQLTGDAAFADVVLPATTGYENLSYMVYGPMFRIRERLIDPVGEARNDFLILTELAERLGYGHLYPQSEEAMLEHVLEGSGFTVDDVRAAGGSVRVPTAMMEYKKWEKGLLRRDGRPGFDTPSGKFEIASTVLTEHGYDPLPVYTEPREGPADRKLAERFPLVFNSGARVRTDFRSQHHGIDGLLKEAPHPVVTINPADAAPRGIADGAEVFVATSRGRVKVRARVTADIVAGTIDVNVGGGGPVGPPAWQECNVNDLTDLENLDPISGFPVYKALLCEVEAVIAGTRGDGEGKSWDGSHEHLEVAAAGGPLPRHDANSEVASAELSMPRNGASLERAPAAMTPDRRGVTWNHGNANRLCEEPAEPATRQSPELPMSRNDASSSELIYMDNNATTALDPLVLEAMMPFLAGTFGNPSSIHNAGVAAADAVDAARRSLAQAINATARRIIFTSGGSEADNLAIKGVARARRHQGNHIVTSAIEHPAVLASCRTLEAEGFDVTYLPVDGAGLVDPADLAKALRPDTILVSIMAANNETGCVQPIRELAAVARENGVPFHTDAVQAFGKRAVDVEELGVDLLSLSGHKIHGPKGIGALFVRAGIELAPIIGGGGQEGGRRSGTENVAGIVGLAAAAELATERLANMGKLARLRDRLQRGIKSAFPDARLNGHPTQRLPNTLNMTLPGFRGESLVLRLDRKGIALSSGSACKSGSPEPSHALLAMGLSRDEAHCSVRFSLSPANTVEQVDRVVAALSDVIAESASAVRFVPCR